MMRSKYQDTKFDYDFGCFNKKTVAFLRYARKESINTYLADYVKILSKVWPKARLVGWDIAITPSGFELIEGNMGSSEDAMQTDFVGKYQFIINNW